MPDNIGFDGGLTCSMQCTDLDKALAWYCEVLGFSLIYRMDDLGWCELRSPVDRVNVGLSQVEDPEVRGGATLTFGVADIGSARAALEAHDVPFDGDTLTHEGMVSLATFYDPDGNKLMIYQDLTEQD